MTDKNSSHFAPSWLLSEEVFEEGQGDVNDYENQAFEDTMSNINFDPQPWGREEC